MKKEYSIKYRKVRGIITKRVIINKVYNNNVMELILLIYYDNILILIITLYYLSQSMIDTL